MPQSSSNAQSSCNCSNDAQTVAWGTDRPTSNSIILRMHIHILGKHTDSLLGPMNHWWVVHASGTINIQKQANQTRVTQFQCHSQPKKRIGHCWHPPKSEFDQASLVSEVSSDCHDDNPLKDFDANLFPAFGNQIRRPLIENCQGSGKDSCCFLQASTALLTVS